MLCGKILLLLHQICHACRYVSGRRQLAAPPSSQSLSQLKPLSHGSHGRADDTAERSHRLCPQATMAGENRVGFKQFPPPQKLLCLMVGVLSSFGFLSVLITSLLGHAARYAPSSTCNLSLRINAEIQQSESIAPTPKEKLWKY